MKIKKMGKDKDEGDERRKGQKNGEWRMEKGEWRKEKKGKRQNWTNTLQDEYGPIYIWGKKTFKTYQHIT